MHSYDSTFHRLLKELVDEELAAQALAVTNRLRTFEEYQYRVGKLDGLRLALLLCEQVERRLTNA